MTDDNVAVQFHRGSPPYEAGDIAGFPQQLAQRYVDRGVAAFWPEDGTETAPSDGFDAMDRATLIAYAKANFGMTDEPPAETTDDQLRAALRAQAAAAQAAPSDAGPGKGGKAK